MQVHTDLKCPFNKKELEKWHKILMVRRAEIRQDRDDLLKDAMDSEDGHTAPTHQADRGSDLDLQDISLGAVGNEEQILWQIERALRKIETGKPIAYGLCEHTQQVIPKSRLSLLPWTPVSIEGATYIERENLMLQDVLLEE